MSAVRLRSHALGNSPEETSGTIQFPSLAPSHPFLSGIEVEGEVYSGSYADVRKTLMERDTPPAALLILGVKGTGMETFLRSLPKELQELPIAGGVVAREDLTGRGDMHPRCEDLTVLALQSGNWTARTVAFHLPTGIFLRIQSDSPRTIRNIERNGQLIPAPEWLAQTAVRLGVQDSFWDRLAFRTPEGRLLHASEGTDGIQLGADLPVTGNLELAILDEAWGRSHLGILPEGSLVFGCAGLHGLLSAARPWHTHPTAYMYGEVLTLKHAPAFANLSFSLLCPSET